MATEKKILTLAPDPLSRLHDLALLVASILFLDLEMKLRLGPEALLIPKIAFLIAHLGEDLPQGIWMENLGYLVPLALATCSLLALGRTDRHRFDGSAQRIDIHKSICLIPFQRRRLSFESLAALEVTQQNKNFGYTLSIVEASGRKTALQHSRHLEKLSSVARKIQEITNLPVRDSIRSA